MHVSFSTTASETDETTLVSARSIRNGRIATSFAWQTSSATLSGITGPSRDKQGSFYLSPHVSLRER